MLPRNDGKLNRRRIDMLPVALGAISAAGSLIGDLLDQSAAKKAQQQAIQAMKALLIPAQETTRRADMYGDNVYTQTMGDLNSGAFAYSGALNPETIRTLAFSKMGVARSQTETAVKEQDYQYNKGIQQQIAQIEAQPLPTIDVTGALGAGVGGYFGGRQLEMSESLMKANEKYLNKLAEDTGSLESTASYFNPNTIGTIGTTLADSQSPFKKRKKTGLGLNMDIPNPYIPSAKQSMWGFPIS